MSTLSSDEEKSLSAFAMIHFHTQGGMGLDPKQLEEVFLEIVKENPYRPNRKVWCRVEDKTMGGLHLSFSIQEAAVLYFGDKEYRLLPIEEIIPFTDWVDTIASKLAERDFKGGPLTDLSVGVQFNGSAGVHFTKAFHEAFA